MQAADEKRWSAVMLAGEAPFRLGNVDVTPATRQVSGPGQRETLEPRVMQVLVALGGAAGGVVSREELLARCWGGRVVGDNAVHRVVGKVRELGQSLGDAFRVETIARVGYRLIVSEAAHLAAASEPGPVPALAAGRWSRRRMLALGAGGVGLAAGAALVLRPPPADPRVAALMAQSEHAMSQGLPDSDAQGAGFLDEAVRLEPRNAVALGKLALARSIMAEYAAPDAMAAAAAATQDAARRALEIDPGQADALSALALLPPYFGDWAAAEARMKDVLERHPDHVPTRDARDFLYVAVGRAGEGARSRLSYGAENPLNAHHQFRLVYAHWITGQNGEADRAAERGMQLWPKHPGIWFSHLWVLAFSGRAERALARVTDAATRPELPPWMVETLRLAMQAIVSGDRGERTRAVAALFDVLARGPSHSINAIMLLNGLGELDHAFDVADAYLLDRGPIVSNLRWRPGEVSINDQRRRKTNMLFVPATAAMRADPRFAVLTREIGLDAYWTQAGVTPDHLS